jgi:HK97 family phage prohead protease
MIELRLLPDNYRPALAEDVPEGSACGNCSFYDEENISEDGAKAYCTKWDDYVDGGYYCNAWQPHEEEDEEEEDEEEDNGYMEERAVSLEPPTYMRNAAKRGLELNAEGFGGDGLVDATIASARKMAAGEVSIEKWRKIGPWIARHLVDLDAPKNNDPSDSGYPGAGLVAHLLWGSGPSKKNAQRAMAHAIMVVENYDEEQRAPAPKKDQIKGSDKNEPGSAKGKEGNISLDANTETALNNKAEEHNAKMKEADKPVWTRVRVGALKSVWRRGAGAYSTSHRPGVSRAAWAMARVNAFIYLSGSGKPQNPKYVTDNDLLHSEHPKFSDARSASGIPDNIIETSQGEQMSDELELDTDTTVQETISETHTVEWVTKSIDGTRSIAYSNLEVRSEGDGTTLVGYAAMWDTASQDLGFTEYVTRGAFTKTLKDGADVRLLFDHDGAPLARTKSGTLRLSEDSRGLKVEADLDPANPLAQQIMSGLRRGDLNQMSFAFRTIKDNWNTDRSVRELREVQLYDVSVVTYPAYEETIAELRNMHYTAPSAPTRLRRQQVAIARLK